MAQKFISLIFYIPVRGDVQNYFLILGEINSYNQSNKYEKKLNNIYICGCLIL